MEFGAFALLKRSKEEEIISYDSWHTEWNCCISDPREIRDQYAILPTHSTGIRTITHFDCDEVVMVIRINDTK